MKLYFSRGACSLAVRIIINEIGIKADFESVDLKTKKTETNKDFTQINGKGSVPTLEIKPGEVLTENAVILQYLAETNNATTLLPPRDDFKHYRVLEWLNYVATELHKGFAPLFSGNLPPETETFLKQNLIKKFTYLDQQLGSKNFLMGDTFTLPDAYLFVMLTWAIHFKIGIEKFSNIIRYFKELQKRKSIAESLKQESMAMA